MQREVHKIPQTVIAFMGYCEVGALRGFDDGSEDLPGSGLIQYIEIPGGLEMMRLCHCRCFLSMIVLWQGSTLLYLHNSHNSPYSCLSMDLSLAPSM